MTRVLVAVDDSDSAVGVAEGAYRPFGDEANYFVMHLEITPSRG